MGNTLDKEKTYLRLSGMIAGNLGALSPEVVDYYINHASEIPAALTRGFVVQEKFSLLLDLGIVTVPDDYVHETALAKFLEQNRKEFYDANKNITDCNFSNPTRVLKPGDKFRVRVFRQIADGETTSAERLNFLRQQKAVFVGAQGTTLVFNQKRDQLPKGKWYTSFDEPDRLWQDADGCHGVPYVRACSVGGFVWRLGDFEDDWSGGSCFLCFCEVE